MTLGFIIGVFVFNNTEHEWEYVKKQLIPTGENVIERHTYRKIYFYNYKPAFVMFTISSALFFLYYNRSLNSIKIEKKNKFDE
ncbi:hypothetical protein SAMN04488028_103209 [Reichenbachiella agariperforans]|uniref:Uncharacterized protein n=1 Tax=Reichenbachiella agariperforans TaxID=156994 RepID=A0A1M6Q879_REIAG|nr:hypothetical protein SAMN04488028_103209 [Reichenbachiella agariperforans]